jgi:TPR repeat protein
MGMGEARRSSQASRRQAAFNIEGGDERRGLGGSKGGACPRRLRDGARIYRRLADLGDARAQNNVGVMYESGLGVTKSYAEAIARYQTAADQDLPMRRTISASCTRWGTRPKDPPRGQWYRLAANQGDANAQHNLGNAYESGHGVPQNHAEAVAWFRKAAGQGHPMAQANLGVMYEHGSGVTQDLILAYMWFSLSVAGFPASEAKNRGIATRNRDQLAATMTPAQIAEAQRLAKAWQPG